MREVNDTVLAKGKVTQDRDPRGVGKPVKQARGGTQMISAKLR
jgi:hypothetical protein